jgi:hypothetical protein
MPQILTGRHAEDVGGQIVEPGGEIPKDADPKVLERLERQGLLADAPKPAKKEE